MHGTEEASKDGRVRVRIIHGLNISHKELTYLLQKSTSHQRWHGVTSWHIYVVVKTLSNLGQALLQTSYKSEPVARTLVPSIGKRVPLWAKR